MKRYGNKWVSGAITVFLAVIMAASLVTRAEAKIKVTVNNKTSQKAFIAFGYGTFDGYGTKGWYSVEAGKSKTITVDAVSSLSRHELYWYAHSEGKNLIWEGDRKEWLHPTKAFEYEYNDRDDGPEEGGAAQAGFRTAKIKDSGDNENGTAAINLTAK
jgi:uncharacterized membrane protein